MSNAVMPLVFTMPSFTMRPSFGLTTISTRVMSFGEFSGCVFGRLSSEPRKLSAKSGWMRLWIVLRYDANGTAAVLSAVWLPGFTLET